MVYRFVAFVSTTVRWNTRYHFQTQDANDKSNWEVAVAGSSTTPAGPDAFSPIPSLSKESEMLSESRGKTKEQDEPLPGGLLFVFPHHLPDRFPLQSIPYLIPTRHARSVSNHSKSRPLPSLLPWRQILLEICRSVSASHAPGNIHTVSRAWQNI